MRETFHNEFWCMCTIRARDPRIEEYVQKKYTYIKKVGENCMFHYVSAMIQEFQCANHFEFDAICIKLWLKIGSEHIVDRSTTIFAERIAGLRIPGNVFSTVML